MRSRPEVLIDRRARWDGGNRPRVSVVLIDWRVRESFHSLHYLSRQTVDRSAYELLWLEFYDHRPDGLRQVADTLDQWIVLGYPDDCVFNKHRLYNVGLLAARGDVCVICDSDAVFAPTFIESLHRAFAHTPDAAIHLDEVRNTRRDFYPFNYPSLEEILGPGCINWAGHTTVGLDDAPDQLHQANYGACFAARRDTLIRLGGADEHLDYLGYVCGPYEMTFRMVNAGHPERWLDDEFLYHTWHPGTTGINADHHGPHDGLFMSLPALDARLTGRTRPLVENPWVAEARRGHQFELTELMERLAGREEPEWRAGKQTLSQEVYQADRDVGGFDVYWHAGRWYALAQGHPRFDPERARRGEYRWMLEAEDFHTLRDRIIGPEGRRIIQEDVWSPGRLWAKLRQDALWRLPGRLLGRCKRKLEAALSL